VSAQQDYLHPEEVVYQQVVCAESVRHQHLPQNFRHHFLSRLLFLERGYQRADPGIPQQTPAQTNKPVK
jgi:hypothetical protein